MMQPDMYLMEEFLLAMVPAVVSGIPTVLFGIAAYVLTAMSLYSLAVRRGIRQAWLSWVPGLNVWVLGSLSDQYRYVVKNQYKSKRKILLLLKIMSMMMTMSVLAMVVALLVGMTKGVFYGNFLEQAMGPILALIGLSMLLSGLTIALAVVRYMALYDVYTSMDPGNNVLYLVLSILFGVTEPFFLFFNRDKDKGMPPRRQAPVYEEPRWQEPVWEQPPVYEQPPVCEEPQVQEETEPENKDYL